LPLKKMQKENQWGEENEEGGDEAVNFPAEITCRMRNGDKVPGVKKKIFLQNKAVGRVAGGGTLGAGAKKPTSWKNASEG